MRDLVPLRAGAGLAAGALTAVFATHAAVRSGRLPCTAISGGRVTDPADGRRIAAASMLALLPVPPLVVRGAGLTGEATRAERLVLGTLAVASLSSVPLQAMGTSFERCWMVPTAAALAVGLGRLAVEQ